MRAAGFDVRTLKEEFHTGAKDPEWLPAAAANGWILLSKDDKWRYRSEEKEILIRARARAFIFMSKSARREEIAEAIVSAMPRIANVIRDHEPPFVARVLLSGFVGVIYPAAGGDAPENAAELPCDDVPVGDS
jgi:hypothetical protein